MFSVIGPEWFSFSPLSSSVNIAPIGVDVEYIEMSVKIIPDWNTSVYIEWLKPDRPDSVVGDPEYLIYYSESELGPFLALTSQPTDNLSFFANWQIQDSKVFEQYFTVECIYPDGKVYRSFPMVPAVGMPNWHRLRQKDIFRRESILLDKFVGIESIIWNPKYTGRRCTECWDKVHLKITNDHCETCYGTSYEGGFDTGMRTKLQYTSIDQQSTVSYQGRIEPITISAWTVAFPLIHPDAIILRVGDRRVFTVEGHQGSTEMLTNTQRQNFVLKELGRDAIENKLFNNTDVIDVMPRKPHNHT